MADLFTYIRWQDILDIIVVYYLTYRIIILIKGTRAVNMLMGLAVIVVSYFFSSYMELFTLNWILSNFLSSIIIISVIIFQSDIRRALTKVGKTAFFAGSSTKESLLIIEELVKAATFLSSRRIGALIVIERDTGLNDYIEIGTVIEANVIKEIIVSIFLPQSPLHDGAIIVQKNKVTAAGCVLPLSTNPALSKNFGTRHRAAIGLTEETDAAVLVVSEETGKVSIVLGGRITRNLDANTLRRVMQRLFKHRR